MCPSVKLEVELCFLFLFDFSSGMLWEASHPAPLYLHCSFSWCRRASICHNTLCVILLHPYTTVFSSSNEKLSATGFSFSGQLWMLGFVVFLILFLFPSSVHLVFSACFSLSPVPLGLSVPLLAILRSGVVCLSMYTKKGVGLFSFQIQFLLSSHFHITFWCTVFATWMSVLPALLLFLLPSFHSCCF